MEEVRKHSSKDDAWMVVAGMVYNVTPYLQFHPGGVDELMRGAGSDATELFMEAHRWVTPVTMLQVRAFSRRVCQSHDRCPPTMQLCTTEMHCRSVGAETTVGQAVVCSAAVPTSRRGHVVPHHSVWQQEDLCAVRVVALQAPTEATKAGACAIPQSCSVGEDHVCLMSCDRPGPEVCGSACAGESHGERSTCHPRVHSNITPWPGTCVGLLSK